MVTEPQANRDLKKFTNQLLAIETFTNLHLAYEQEEDIFFFGHKHF